MSKLRYLAIACVGFIAVVAVCLVALNRRSATMPVDSNSPLRRVSCDYTYALNKRLSCYQYFASIAPNSPKSASFVLPVVVIHPKQPVYSEPVVYLSGGPGAMFITGEYSVNEWAEWSDEANLGRDIVLYDVRGAKPGKPSWDCDKYTEASKKYLMQNLSYVEEAKLMVPIVDECLANWDKRLSEYLSPMLSQGSGWALGLFSTTANVIDLEGIMVALGFDRWNLVADSYGTRLAMAAAVTLQEHIEALVLDSPYPVGFGALDDAIIVWHSAFERLFSRYRSQGLKEKYSALAAKLNGTPLLVTVEDWSAGESVSWVLNEVRLASVVYSSMYVAEFQEKIPSAVSGLLNDDSTAAQGLLEVFYNNAFSEDFNTMIYFATECNDNPEPSLSEFEHALDVAHPWARYFSSDWEFDICRNKYFVSPPMVSSAWTQRTLITSGALDPVTDVGYARATLENASNGSLITFPNKSHAEFIFSDCGRQLIPDFINPSDKQDRDSLSRKLNKCNGEATLQNF